MPPKGNSVAFPSLSAQKRLWFRRVEDSPEEKFEEIKFLTDSVSSLELTEEAHKEPVIDGSYQKEISFGFTLDEKSSEEMRRLYYKLALENMVYFIRSCFKTMGPGVKLTMRMSEEKWRELSYASHLIAGCNPTRYFRPLVSRNFKGFLVYLESGRAVKRK